MVQHRPSTEPPDRPAWQKRGWVSMVKSAAMDFTADDALTQAGAVAFYTALSFAPLLMLATFVFANLDRVAGTGTEQQVITEVHRLIGTEAGRVVEDVREQQMEQQRRRSGFMAFTGVIGIIVLIWSASGVFVQLQYALNRIWDVEQAPGAGLRNWLRARGVSVSVVFAILFLLLASLIVTAIINAVTGRIGGGPEFGILWQAINLGVSLAIYTVLFAMIFKFLPDVILPWRTVWAGAVVTAILFAVGQFLISLYISQADPASAYGGAGSVVLLLIWVYYSACILFFGAELTQAWAKHMRVPIRPSVHARAAHSPKQEPANDAAADRRAKQGKLQ